MRAGLLALALVAASAHAQRMQPGEWEFVSEVSVPSMPPQQSAYRSCLSAAQARDPVAWSNGRLPADCQVSEKLGPGSVSWEISCPSGTRGAGKARFSANSMSSELRMSGGIVTKTRGNRVGPCKP